MAVDRRALWLGGVLVAAVVAVMVVRSMNESTPTRPTAPRARQQNARGVDGQDAAPVAVNLEALRRLRGEPSGPGRDPFRFRPKPAPPPETMPSSPQSRPSTPGNQDAAAPVQPPRAMGPPPPPPIPLKFIGVVTKLEGGKEVKIAVLSDGKLPVSQQFHGVEGSTIDGRYQILKIGEQSIEMAYVDGRGRTSIRLSGQ